MDRDTTLNAIMTTDVVRINGNKPLVEVKNLLNKRGFHHVLVVEEDRLLGVISDRDVLRALSPFLDTIVEQPRDVNTLGMQARQVMSCTLITAGPSSSVCDAAELMINNHIHCLPVTDDKGELLGIVTTQDLLAHLASL
jgi:acetoin utilization protein AcuB